MSAGLLNQKGFYVIKILCGNLISEDFANPESIAMLFYFRWLSIYYGKG